MDVFKRPTTYPTPNYICTFPSFAEFHFHVQCKSMYLLTKQPVAFKPIENISREPSPDLHPKKVHLLAVNDPHIRLMV